MSTEAPAPKAPAPTDWGPEVEELRRRRAEIDASISDDVFDVLTLRGSLNARSVLGGTAPVQVRAQIARHRTRLA